MRSSLDLSTTFNALFTNIKMGQGHCVCMQQHVPDLRIVCRSMSPAASLPASTPPEDASSHNAGSPPMNGRKRSLTQELADSGSAGVAIPRKAGMSAHGGLEYHRYMAASCTAPNECNCSNLHQVKPCCLLLLAGMPFHVTLYMMLVPAL